MLIEISVLVIAVFVVIFVVGLLIVFMQIRRTAREAEKFLDTARHHVAPLAHDAAVILNDTKKVVQSIERQIDKMEDGVTAIKETAEHVRQFEADIAERIEEPLLEITSFVAALARVLRAIGSFAAPKKQSQHD